jgi:hypothetical protein
MEDDDNEPCMYSEKNGRRKVQDALSLATTTKNYESLRKKDAMMKTDVQASKSIVNFVKYKAKVVF